MNVFIYLFMFTAILEESYENHFVFSCAYLGWIRDVNFSWAIVKLNSNKVNKEGFKMCWKMSKQYGDLHITNVNGRHVHSHKCYGHQTWTAGKSWEFDSF